MKLALRTLLRSGRSAPMVDDGACPTCDHPFPMLSHMCFGGSAVPPATATDAAPRILAVAGV